MKFKAKSCSTDIIYLFRDSVNAAVEARVENSGGETCTVEAAHSENVTEMEGQRERLDGDDSPEQYACRIAPPGLHAARSISPCGGAENG